eukprot:9240338-Pyramimonas_sp.AAC.1
MERPSCVGGRRERGRLPRGSHDAEEDLHSAHSFITGSTNLHGHAALCIVDLPECHDRAKCLVVSVCV